MQKHDNFLADATKASRPRVSYVDGFRFGLGFFIAGWLLCLVVGCLTWALILLSRVHY